MNGLRAEHAPCGRWLALFIALAGVALPASHAFALNPAVRDAITVSVDAELATIEALEEACTDCVDPNADEELVDEDAAAVEMHATTPDEAATPPTELLDPSAPAPLPLPLRDGTGPARNACMTAAPAGGAFVGPACNVVPSHGPNLLEVLDPQPADTASAQIVAPTLATAVSWLRQRRSTPSSDDAHASPVR